MNTYKYDLSIVLGTFNRKRLLIEAIKNVRNNLTNEKVEIIVIDGGSKDGTIAWLSRQKDIHTIVQPNPRIKQPDGSLKMMHSLGEFINIGFKLASAPWVLMISDDLLLCKGVIKRGLHKLNKLINNGYKIGGGAIFWRDYPRSIQYHVKLLPHKYIHINHGFYNKEALEEVGYFDETHYDGIYYSDADLTMRLNIAGWKTVELENCFAEHLNHRINMKRFLFKKLSPGHKKSIKTFEDKYGNLNINGAIEIDRYYPKDKTYLTLWRLAPINCLQGLLLRRLNINYY
jgi:glycosyltransferase involved in cell wall biosynthesis